MTPEVTRLPSPRWASPLVVVGALAAVAVTLWFLVWKQLAATGPLHAFRGDLATFADREAAFFLVTAVTQALVTAFGTLALRARWPGAFDRAFRGLLARPGATYLTLGGLTAVLGLVIGVGLLESHAITEDEKTYLLQARLLLQGRLSAPVPHEAAALWQPFVVMTEGRWSGQYFWAQPLALIPSVLTGLAPLTGALEAGMTVYFTGKLAAEYADDTRAGVLAALLAALSPILVLTGGTALNANLSATCATASLWALARLARRQSRTAFVILGLSTGIGLHNRTSDQVAVLLSGGLLLLIHLRKDLGAFLRRVGPAVLVSLPLLALHPIINRLAYGDWSTTGYALFNGGHGWKTMGFGLGPFGRPHTPAVAASKTFAVFVRMTFYTTGSPLGIALLTLPILGLRRSMRSLAPGLVVATHAVLYFFYAGTPVDPTGPVYYVAMAPVLLGWLAVVAVELHDRLRSREGLGRVVPAFLVAQAIAGLLVFWPPQLGELLENVAQAKSCESAVAAAGIRRGLIFAQIAPSPTSPPRTRTWAQRPPLPVPPFDEPLIYARPLGPKVDAKTAARFAGDRPVYFQRCMFADDPGLFRYDPERSLIAHLDGTHQQPIAPQDSGDRPVDSFDWNSMTWLDGSNRPAPWP